MTHMEIRFLHCIIVGTLFTGCSFKDLSKVDPFSDYVGQTVELRRPMSVVERRSIFSLGPGVMTRSPADYGLENVRYPISSAFPELPIGHQLRIESVWDEVVIDGEHIIAYCRTTIPPGTNEVRVAYPWGFIWVLERAPWEPDTVPEYRYPPTGKPPRFGWEMYTVPTNPPTWGTNGWVE